MLSKILQWLFKKLSGVVLIVALGLAGLGLWLYLSDSLSFEERKAELVRVFNGEREKLQAAKAAQVQRQQSLEKELKLSTERLALCARALTSLGELESGWDRLWGNREAQRDYARRSDELRALQQKERARVVELENALRLEGYTREGLDIALGKLEKRIEQARSTESRVLTYGRRAWDRCKFYLLVAVASWLLGPLLWKMSMYYLVAPLVSRGRPLRFSELRTELPEVLPSQVALEITLQPGESMRIKERFLQASDESLKKRTRWLMDWSMPFTSVACGLVEMIEISHPGDERLRPRATLSCSDDALAELSLIRIPAGTSLILSPRQIAGLMRQGGGGSRIRRRWVLWRWQSWVSLQFRYFEFEGPMQVVLSGARGIRVENLSGRGAETARRVNHNAIIGFTPNLRYSPVRAETFWAYYRGMNPLFDDLFAGDGLFLCQANAKPQDTKGEKFWSSIWGGVLRVFGL
jgi:hypothetical protein